MWYFIYFCFCKNSNVELAQFGYASVYRLEPLANSTTIAFPSMESVGWRACKIWSSCEASYWSNKQTWELVRVSLPLCASLLRMKHSLKSSEHITKMKRCIVCGLIDGLKMNDNSSIEHLCMCVSASSYFSPLW